MVPNPKLTPCQAHQRAQDIDDYMEMVVYPNGIKLDHEDGSHAPITSCLMQEDMQVGPDEGIL